MAACHANKKCLCIIVCGTMNNSCTGNQAFALISQSYCIKCFPTFTFKSSFQAGKPARFLFHNHLSIQCGNFDFPLSHDIYHQLIGVKGKGKECLFYMMCRKEMGFFVYVLMVQL